MITRNRILFAIGLWNVLLPFLGFPGTYRTFFIIASGLAIILLAFLYARDKRFSAGHHSQLHPHHETLQSYPKSQQTSAPAAASAPTPSPSQFASSSHFGAPIATQERFTDLKSIINRTKTF